MQKNTKSRKKDSKAIKKLFELQKKMECLLHEITQTDILLFKNETNYLARARGMPITKDCEYYINIKPEKKFEEISFNDRIFGTVYPGHD